MLVDAPCSGLGTLRRDPDIRWRRNERDLPALAAAELVMLQHAAAAVAPGGRLVYATCSSEPDENEGVVDAFLATTPAFAPLDAREAAPRLPRELIDARGHLRTEPHAHGLEAFFGAVLVKNETGAECRVLGAECSWRVPNAWCCARCRVLCRLPEPGTAPGTPHSALGTRHEHPALSTKHPAPDSDL